MEQPARLNAWMNEQGYSYRQLAEQLGLSYEYIFKIAQGDRAISVNFKLKFISRFGREEAAKAFDASSLFSILETA